MTDKIQPHIIQRFDVLEKIGSGAYGHVWRVLDRKDHGRQKALKKNFDAFSNATDSQRTYRQVAVLSQLRDHPNIIRLDEVIRAHNDKDVYLVFEYMEADLFTLIRQNLLSQRHKKYILYQMALCLHYLHQCGLVHRDFKPSNILINEQCDAKLCDFGLVRTVEPFGKTKADNILTEYIATRWYRAPQILLGAIHYSKAIDVWSFGCLLAELIKGKPLFPGNSTTNQLERVLSWTGLPTAQELQHFHAPSAKQILQTVSQSLRRISHRQQLPQASNDCLDLLEQTLHLMPGKRPSFSQILGHPYLSEFFDLKDLEDVKRTKHPIKLDIDDNVRLTIKDYRDLVYGEDKSTRSTDTDYSKNNGTGIGYRIREGKKSGAKNKSLPTEQDEEPIRQVQPRNHLVAANQLPHSSIESKIIAQRRASHKQASIIHTEGSIPYPHQIIPQKPKSFTQTTTATTTAASTGISHTSVLNGGQTRPIKHKDSATVSFNPGRIAQQKGQYPKQMKTLEHEWAGGACALASTLPQAIQPNQEKGPIQFDPSKYPTDINKLIRRSQALHELERERLEARRRKAISQHTQVQKRERHYEVIQSHQVQQNGSQPVRSVNDFHHRPLPPHLHHTLQYDTRKVSADKSHGERGVMDRAVMEKAAIDSHIVFNDQKPRMIRQNNKTEVNSRMTTK